MHSNSQGDVIIVATKNSDKQGEWILTGDIRVRFPNSRSSSSTYKQQRCQHSNKDTRAERLLTYSGQVRPIFVPERHTSEASEDASLHRVHIACATFRGRDGGSLLQLFRDTLSTIYENIITLDSVEAFQMPEDYFTTLNEVVEVATDLPRVELDARTELYLFEFSKITKTGGQQPLCHSGVAGDLNPSSHHQ
jgi:hypothetical protein